MKILIDGDSCPIVKIVEKIAKTNAIPCHIYADFTKEITSDYSKVHIVDKHRDSADFAILYAYQPGDIVITNDSGLAAMLLAKEGYIMSSYGYQYTNANIGILLQRRYLHDRVKHTNKHNHSHKGIAFPLNIRREGTASLLQRLIKMSAKRSNHNKKNTEGTPTGVPSSFLISLT